MNIHANLDPGDRAARNKLPDDTRGILDPAAMMRLVAFDRTPPGESLEGVIEWFWSVSWDLPAGVSHDQQVLNHPAGNVSIGTLEDSGVSLDPAVGRVYGVVSGLSHRRPPRPGHGPARIACGRARRHGA